MKLEAKFSKGNSKRKKKSSKGLNCTIYFLDQSTETIQLPASSKGIHLLMLAYKHENLFETRSFGLRFSCGKDAREAWLVGNKSLGKQFRCTTGDVSLYFKVKFFPDYPSQIEDTQSRSLVFLQLWQNVSNKILPCQTNTASLLASYFLQATYGDFISESHDAFNLSQLQIENFALKENYCQIIELHKLLSGLSTENAQRIFLDHVRRLEMYGVDLHPAKDCHGKLLNLGISSKGITVYLRDLRMNTFSWSKITKIYFKQERFFIQLLREQPEDFDTVVGFCLEDYRKAKTLWTSCIEFHAFYFTGTSPNYEKINKGLFPRFRKILKTGSCYTITHCKQPSFQSNETWMTATYRRFDQLNKIQNLSCQVPPRKAWTSSSSTSIVKSHDVIESTQSNVHSFESPASPISAFVPYNMDHTIYYADDDIEDSDGLPLYLEPQSASQEKESSFSENLINVELSPDDSGRLGFNVRFQGERRPVSVSRIVPNSPADLSYPPVRLGDQIVSINGRLVHLMSQKEIVDILQSAKFQKLQMALQRCRGYDSPETEESPVEYIMDEARISASQSIVDLLDGLQSGSLLSAFELLYRQRMELSCSEARNEENLKKNRYGDIFPYDYNRVLLQSSPYGDYINASHVTMSTSDKMAPVRYIATQGPLPHTVEDFWCLVWDYKVEVVAMVTPESERGALKCHRYWPDLGETVRAGDWIINCLKINHFDNFLQREFVINNLMSQEVRKVIQVSYSDWPDHGVPISASHFTQFVRYVQGLRREEGHLVVHCSAGIGRTGAFILLDTAIRCLQRGVPVDPLRLVRMMRDQRPMMIQTSSQFRYICECMVDVARELNI